jgi:hypothetical protein
LRSAHLSSVPLKEESKATPSWKCASGKSWKYSETNAFDQRLRTHKLSGRLKDLWSFSVEYDLRIVFAFLEGDQALFVDIGTHEEVY